MLDARIVRVVFAVGVSTLLAALSNGSGNHPALTVFVAAGSFLLCLKIGTGE